MKAIDINSLEIFKTNRYFPTEIGMVSDNAYLSIVATNKCQCNCAYCINSETDRTLSIQVDKAIANIKKLVAKYGVKEAIILGGEPTLHPDIIGLVKRLRHESGLKMIRLTTNGIRLKNERFLHELIDFTDGIQGINISCHNEDFMPYDELNQICKNIKDINPLIKIRINSNIWKGNLDNVCDFLSHYEILHDNIDEMRVSNIIPKDSFSVNLENKGLDMILTDSQYEKIFTDIIESCSDVSPIVNYKTLGFVKYVLIPIDKPIIINWNIGSTVSEQICENDIKNREINTFKCLVSGDVSLSWNESNKIML